MQVSFELDSLYAGGDNLWVSAEVGVAKWREQPPSTEDVAEGDAAGEGAAAEGGVAGEDAVAEQRAPVDLLVVVDISGSMHSALPSVRKCLASLSGLVEERDRLALVMFDDRAECVLPWTAMDEEGRAAFILAQEELKSRGGTCFIPVWKLNFDELLQDEVPGRSRSVLFISDGYPWESDHEILKLLCEQSSATNLTVVAAGFGSGVKGPLMQSIAQTGCGPFVYIPNEQNIPMQLGRIWAAVAHTSLCANFLVVRPLGGARITAVEGAFGSAELSLRPDGQKSEQQVMLVQLGPVRYGTTREVAFRVKLPNWLQNRPLQDKTLRRPLLDISLLSEAVTQLEDQGGPVFMQRTEFLPLQVPSLLADALVPFPIRFVLEDDLTEDFDAEAVLRQVAETLGVEEGELELNRILRGSIILDVSLKVPPERAGKVLQEVGTATFQERASEALGKMGYKLKTVKASGQLVLKRLLQTRFAGALGAAAKAGRDEDDVPELRAVKQLANSELAGSLDPPGPESTASAVAKDCTMVLEKVHATAGSSGADRLNMQHDMLQMQAAHVAQYKCQTKAASLEVYEVPEAKVAAQRMQINCAGVRVTRSFLETLSNNVELRLHRAAGERVGVMLLLKPMFGKEMDFHGLVGNLCPTFQVQLEGEGDAAVPRHACAHPVLGGSMVPILCRTSHPCTLEDHHGGKISVPFARRLKVSVDKRSCFQSTLSFYVDSTCQKPFKVVHYSKEPAKYEKPDTFYVQGEHLWYTYRHASTVPLQQQWGFEFEVVDASPAEEGDTHPRGMLLQATFPEVGPGPYRISARLSPEIFEFPPRHVQARESPGGAEQLASAIGLANQCLVLEGPAASLLGVSKPTRLLGVNGRAAEGKINARALLEAVAPKDTAQATLLTDVSYFTRPVQELAEEKLAKVPEELQQKFVASFVGSL